MNARATLQTIMTPAQAAEALCMSITTLRAHVKDGTLTYINIGRGVKKRRMAFDPQDIAAFIERRKGVSCPSTSTRNHSSGNTISSSAVIGFTARLEQQRNAKRSA